jgi:tetratricopeptide (TPR) repeat protein
MKKSKRTQAETSAKTAAAPSSNVVWWPWAALALALFVAFEAFGPALHSPFVMDDLYLPFADPKAELLSMRAWVTASPRPLLYISYFVNYLMSGTEPGSYHIVSLLLHFATTVAVAWVTYRILVLAEVVKGRLALTAFAGGVFLLHPLATESVVYIAGRSEVLSVLFFMTALGLFLRKSDEPLGLPRSLAIFGLFVAALASKEHTIMLPFILVLADRTWGLGGLRRNGILYGLLTAGALVGGIFALRTLSGATTVGFNIRGITPLGYFFTECRVIWSYVRLFLLPFGQNFDPDIPMSAGPLDHGAVFGLLALIALAAGAWIYRQRFPLASFGVAIFLLLLAPTSSILPLQDVMAERRVYLPFLGLLLICTEFLRRLPAPQIGAVAAAAAVVCAVLTFQRSTVWADPMRLWEDTVAKSPQKWRPRFQLAYEQYRRGDCPRAVDSYAAASKLGPSDVPMLLNWGLALDCAGRASEAVEKVIEASKREHSAHIMSQIGMLYAKQNKLPEAVAALKEAERVDPTFVMTYVYRGGVYELSQDRPAAIREYKRALEIDPTNQPARTGLARVSQ